MELFLKDFLVICVFSVLFSASLWLCAVSLNAFDSIRRSLHMLKLHILLCFALFVRSLFFRFRIIFLPLFVTLCRRVCSAARVRECLCLLAEANRAVFAFKC